MSGITDGAIDSARLRAVPFYIPRLFRTPRQPMDFLCADGASERRLLPAVIRGVLPMYDALFPALILGLFGVGWAYLVACDRV